METTSTNQFANFYSKYKVAIWLTVIILQQTFLMVMGNGTGDDGDSVNHYLHNRYAFDYPWLFIHSWAKPLFVLTSCLFAQLGFIGIKIFNSLMAIGAAYLAYKLAKKIKLPYAELAMPILMFMPDYLRLSLSGLTEPLFSIMVVGAILCLANNRNALGSLIIGFMPFARPEGLFFIAIAFVYFLIIKKGWKYIPLLFFGHLFYTVIGVVFVDQNWDWVFADNPNAVLTPHYGITGRWLHYIKQLVYVIGIPNYVFFWIGSLVMGIYQLKNIKKLRENLIPAFILAGTFSVIVAHTIFWKFGLFKSFGLTRNLLTVAPLMAIIILAGMQGLWKLFKFGEKRVRNASAFVMLLIVVALYSGSKYTCKFLYSFNLDSTQVLSHEVAHYIQDHYDDINLTFHYYPYMDVYMDTNPFDWRRHRNLFKDVVELPIPGNSIVVWDEWFAPMDGKVPLELLENHPELEHVKTFETEGKDHKFVLFQTKVWE